MKTIIEEVNAATRKIGERLYQQAGTQGGAQAPGDAGGAQPAGDPSAGGADDGTKKDDENVVDAEFEVIEEEKEDDKK